MSYRIASHMLSHTTKKTFVSKINSSNTSSKISRRESPKRPVAKHTEMRPRIDEMESLPSDDNRHRLRI